MILVDGLPLPAVASPSGSQGGDLLLSLLEHPSLVAASQILVSTPEKNAQEVIGHRKHVYVFQKEYATVDPILVQFIGTDEATTCVGIVIRNQKSGMTSVAHFDFPDIVDSGLAQMLSSVLDRETDAPLDVHLIGAFNDMKYGEVIDSSGSNFEVENVGHSFPLCSKIIEALQSSREKFQLRTLCVLGHNTTKRSNGYDCPIISGFLVETSSGSMVPASFDTSSRCPDELVRRLRLTVCSMDPSLQGKLLETYDTRLDRFIIAPFSWRSAWADYAKSVLQLSDSEYLCTMSTSPFAEAPDFVDTQRRIFSYLIEYSDWRQTFPKRKAHIFRRTDDGGWLKCDS